MFANWDWFSFIIGAVVMGLLGGGAVVLLMAGDWIGDQ
jgi:hypothetical protein